MVDPTFVEINVQNTTDSEKSLHEILEPIANRNELNPYNTVSYVGTEENPIIRLIYESIEDLEASYKESEVQLQKFLTLVENELFNLDELKTIIKNGEKSGSEWRMAPQDEIYLILRYRTNHKSPLRQNYSFGKWFFDFFNDQIMFEEVNDGFLIFYHREVDFINSNYNKLNPVEIRLWLKGKNVDIDSDFMKKLLKLMNP
ncbi:MAG: hypothetical protein ACTSRK_16630 [Promethearchaeota archaeon]